MSSYKLIHNVFVYNWHANVLQLKKKTTTTRTFTPQQQWSTQRFGNCQDYPIAIRTTHSLVQHKVYTHTHMQRNVKSTQWNSGTVYTVFAHWTLPSYIQCGHWCYFVFVALLFVNLFVCLRKQKQNKWIFKLRFGKISPFPIGEWMRNLFCWVFCSLSTSLRWIVVFLNRNAIKPSNFFGFLPRKSRRIWVFFNENAIFRERKKTA